MLHGSTGVHIHRVTCMKDYQNKPEPLGMLLRVRVLNLDTDTDCPTAASRAMRFCERFTGSTARHSIG